MKVPQLLICVVLLVKRYKTSGEEIHGYESSSVSITCSHSWAGSNKKYFCKDPCETNVDILIDSTKKSSGRYRLTDSGTGVFTVEIARLTPQTSPSPSSSTHLPTTVTSLGNISTSNATFAAVSVSAPAASDQSNNAKTTDWRTYLIVSVCVLLMTSVVWILAFLGLYYNICAHPILESQCCSKSKEFDASDCDGNSFGKQSSVSRSRPPAAEDTEPDYENIFNATTKFPAEPNTYSNQWK
ncbi:uncharacterized protein LOC108443871 isoform X2 [Pygocentrus nattereri]|uniref:uncharacterized protein LOC108443871 isoform X2 n=1 Tax=Pygocentrus nattereri TaxID=42514 RepID=UPI0018918140|nr:uncharacterized protein LOC108443871 isoform X2 [Pygocentrus nattereri]